MEEDGPLITEINQVQARILKILLKEGRKSLAEIAKETGETKEVVHKDYMEMEKEGIIKGATIHINYKSFGYLAVANLLINVDSSQASSLIEYVRKMEDIYSVFSSMPTGNVRVVATLRTLQQLDKIKDEIKHQFPILNLRTVIWTDVKEMHENLSIKPQGARNEKKENSPIRTQEKNIEQRKTRKNGKIDHVDLKIAEILSKNGRTPLNIIAQETGTSIETINRRYRKLVQNGVMKVTIQIDPTKIGYQALGIFYIAFTLHEDSCSIIENMSKIPDIISIMKTSGDYDLQVYAMIRDINQLLAIQDEFSKIQGIARIDMDILRILDTWPTPRQYISTF